ncbi:MAG: tRNA 2-thiouridine(34) synthase MnmA [Candidatus Margulisiibacteriota bacterium]
MNKKIKVLVAMSGGVDSSVAAILLKEQGYDLVGVTMNLYCGTKASETGCCSLSAAADAKKVADKLGFPHYTLNFKDEFEKQVIENFIDEYKHGRTPNPCIRCNQFLKFDLLMQKAKELGAGFVASGHYARIDKSEILNTKSETNPCLPAGTAKSEYPNYKLLKGKDDKKDQSYVLYRMTQETLAHTLFPLGDLTKEEVRKIARKHSLAVAEKAESQEICFVEDDDYIRFMREKAPEVVKPGNIIDLDGKVVGKHEGIAFYTIGQRKGVGAHKGIPMYVIKIDPGENTITIGGKESVFGKELMAGEVSFIDGKWPPKPIKVEAKIRYNSPVADAVVTPLDQGNAEVVFTKPQMAITPGQSVVFYQGEETIGGGIIR